MTPGQFLDECSRRGIALSVTEAGGIRYRAPGTLPDAVRDTLTRHKAAIITALQPKPEPDTHTLPDGRMLYRWGESDWRYVPPGGDPTDHIDNFPAELRGVARWRYATNAAYRQEQVPADSPVNAPITNQGERK